MAQTSTFAASRVFATGPERSPRLATRQTRTFAPRALIETSLAAAALVVADDQAVGIPELGAARLIITHWGTFRLGDEPVHFPPMEIKREMEKEGLADRLVHLNHGETLFL